MAAESVTYPHVVFLGAVVLGAVILLSGVVFRSHEFSANGDGQMPVNCHTEWLPEALRAELDQSSAHHLLRC